jgi:type IV secretion system protein VirB4
MRKLLKRKADELEAYRDITDDVDEAIFVPYACHVDPLTILTKNGELMQTIKITAFAYEHIEEHPRELREVIREALRSAINTTDYALWMHTVRRKVSLTPEGKPKNPLSQRLNDAWRQQNDWDNQYTNEVYLTFVKEGESASITQSRRFFRSLVSGIERKARWGYIEQAHQDLDEVVAHAHQALERFGAQRLGLHEKDGVVYSDLVSFLGKIAHLEESEMPLPEVPLDDYLTSHDVTFGFNAMEVRDQHGRRRFGALLMLKEYHELSGLALDSVLQVPAEFIITQTLDFINHRKALTEYKDQQSIIDLGQDNSLSEQIGLKGILESERGLPVDFGEQQICCFIISDNVHNLEKSVRRVTRTFDELGVVAVREDVKFQEAYWAQLPANFEFLRRLRAIDTQRVAGFCSISNLPSGLKTGSKWGAPVTLLRTAAQTPYYFNFHVGENGHTCFIGRSNPEKTSIINFLVSEADKFEPRIFYFDREKKSELFLRGLNCQYYNIERLAQAETDLAQPLTAPKDVPLLNPLQLDDTPQNRSFLLVWFDMLVRADPYYRPEMSQEFWPLLEQALDYIYTLPKPQRYLSNVIEHLNTVMPKVTAKLQLWHRQGMFARWFDQPEDTLNLSSGRIGFEMARAVADTKALPAVFGYLMHRVMMEIDGRPTLVVIDEAWDLLDNPAFSARIGNWLQMLRARNVVVVATSNHIEEIVHNRLTPLILEQMSTHIFLPNPIADMDAYQEVFGLPVREAQLVRLMNSKKRQFMIRRGMESAVAEIDLSRLPELASLLSASAEDRQRAERLIQQHHGYTEGWIDAFLQPVKTHDKAA